MGEETNKQNTQPQGQDGAKDESRGQQTAAPPEGFIPKERYDELSTQVKALQDTVRALTQPDDTSKQGETIPAPVTAGTTIPDQVIEAYAKRTGLSIEEAKQNADLILPLVEQVGQQYTAILGGLADRLATMQIRSHPTYGKFYAEHEKDINRLREDAARSGQYLSPENALQAVAAQKFLQGEPSPAGNTGPTDIDTTTVRARAASADHLQTVRSGTPREGPATVEDIAAMSPEDRKKFLEEAAEQGKYF